MSWLIIYYMGDKTKCVHIDIISDKLITLGMLTDSRSFVSYTRHEYFRRIMCNLIGKWVEDGEYPNDWDSLKNIVDGISYYNAKEYFEF